MAACYTKFGIIRTPALSIFLQISACLSNCSFSYSSSLVQKRRPVVRKYWIRTNDIYISEHRATRYDQTTILGTRVICASLSGNGRTGVHTSTLTLSYFIYFIYAIASFNRHPSWNSVVAKSVLSFFLLSMLALLLVLLYTSVVHGVAGVALSQQ